ncbi:hypothetical protein J6590_084540, partial [Homalodisca vitripennis]
TGSELDLGFDDDTDNDPDYEASGMSSDESDALPARSVDMTRIEPQHGLLWSYSGPMGEQLDPSPPPTIASGPMGEQLGPSPSPSQSTCWRMGVITVMEIFPHLSEDKSAPIHGRRQPDRYDTHPPTRGLGGGDGRGKGRGLAALPLVQRRWGGEGAGPSCSPIGPE